MSVFAPKSWFRQFSDWLAAPRTVTRFYPRPAPAPLAWSQCSRIVILKLDEIGDFVLVTPFLRSLRHSAPRAVLALVVKPALLNLAETCPYVDRVLTYDGQTKGLSAWQLRRQWRALRLARTSLRTPQADVVVIPRWGEDAYNATHLAAFSRPRAIIAYSETATAVKRAMNQAFDRLVSHVVEPSTPRHEVEHHLALLQSFGGAASGTTLELWPTADDRAFASKQLPDGKEFVALATGAGDPLRQWPPDRFAALAAWLRATHGLDPVIFGAADDPAVAGALDLRGRTTLRQATAALARCRLFFGNDSGLKHLAAAAGVPVVEVSALRRGSDPNHGNSPARFRAWGVPTRVLQPGPGAGSLAIAEIPSEAAQSACAELLVLPART